MNDTERDQWLAAADAIAAPDELLKHHANLEAYLEGLTSQVKNIKRVIKHLETRTAERALTEGQRDAAFNHGDVNLNEKTVYSVNDWDAFYAWIHEDPVNRIGGYLHKREGSTAIGKHHKDFGELPPGCEEKLFTEVKVKSRQLQLDPEL